MFKGIRKNVSLKILSRIKIGGKAQYFFEAKSIKRLIEVLEYWKKSFSNNFNNVFVIGDSTNILFPDGLLKGLVIRNKISFIKSLSKNTLYVGAGTPVKKLLSYSLANNLSGLEWASGLPGTIGGAIFGNAGCFGGEIKDIVIGVISLDFEKDKFKIRFRSNKECKFKYRESIFKVNNNKNLKHIILGAYIKLQPMKSFEKSKKLVKEILNYRKTKHPMEFPTLGSTFKNIPVSSIPKSTVKLFYDKIKNDPKTILPAAVLLSQVKMSGYSVGKAEFSKKHCNFIINLKNASFDDVKKLIQLAQRKVFKKFGVYLEPEIRIFS
jgi:UDP-N-acetylmuramate dehydrogenase